MFPFKLWSSPSDSHFQPSSSVTPSNAFPLLSLFYIFWSFQEFLFISTAVFVSIVCGYTDPCAVLLARPQSRRQHVSAANSFNLLYATELWFQQQLEIEKRRVNTLLRITILTLHLHKESHDSVKSKPPTKLVRLCVDSPV